MKSFFQQVYAQVRKIPRGKVATYGQIAAWLGDPRAARMVGWALHALNDPDSGIPWHRVINARGEISLGAEHAEELQRKLLEAEGVRFNRAGTVELTIYQWQPRPPRQRLQKRTNRKK